jgi:hypothetical protein
MRMSGEQFNEQYKNKTFVKLTRKNEIHNGFEFKTGLNIDFIEFNPTGQCKAGGLYFTDIDIMYKWLHYNDEYMEWMRFVTIPMDAQIYVEDSKFKCDKFILSEREEIAFKDNIQMMNAIKQSYMALRYVKDQTPELCLYAIQQDCWALQFVKEQTDDLCKIAIKKSGSALQFVNNQTYEMCKIAVYECKVALQFVRNKDFKFD